MQLDTPLEKIFKIQDDTKKALRKLRIFTVKDLLYHFPVRYGDSEEVKQIKDLNEGDTAVIMARLRI
jgi:ATP-dependent DNA helicase RecG